MRASLVFAATVDAADASLAAYRAMLPLPTVAVPLAAAVRATPIDLSVVDAVAMDVHLGDVLMRAR